MKFSEFYSNASKSALEVPHHFWLYTNTHREERVTAQMSGFCPVNDDQQFLQFAK